MNTDVATLQTIADTLKEEPLASQRLLAEKAGISIGLMNAILKRFVERGWIMLSNVNRKKLCYAITPSGIAELTSRGQQFARRTFALANKYNDRLCKAVACAKENGKKSLALYGPSYIKFLLAYACQTLGLSFVEKDVKDSVLESAFCLVGEQCDEKDIERLTKEVCLSLLDLMER